MDLGEEKKISIQDYLNMYDSQLPEFSKMCVVTGMLGGRIEAQNCDAVWKAVKKWPNKIQKKLHERLKIIEKLDDPQFKTDPETHMFILNGNELQIVEELLGVSSVLGIDIDGPDEENAINKDAIEHVVEEFNSSANIERHQIDLYYIGVNELIKSNIQSLHNVGLVSTGGLGNPLISQNDARGLLLLLPSSKQFFKECQETKMSLTEILQADDLFNFIDDDDKKDDKLEGLKKVFDVDGNHYGDSNMIEYGDLLLERNDVLDDLVYAKKAVQFYYKQLPIWIKGTMGKPMLSFAYKLLKKYDRLGNEDNFKALQKYVAECTENILGTEEINSAMENISTFLQGCDSINPSTTDDFIKNVDAMIVFLEGNGIVEKSKSNESHDNFGFDDSLSRISVNKFSEINVDKWDVCFEALKFFFSNFFTDFDVWRNSASAEQRIKSSRFIDQFKTKQVKVNIKNDNTESKSISVFDLLKKEIPMLVPKLEDENIK